MLFVLIVSSIYVKIHALRILLVKKLGETYFSNLRRELPSSTIITFSPLMQPALVANLKEISAPQNKKSDLGRGEGMKSNRAFLKLKICTISHTKFKMS